MALSADRVEVAGYGVAAVDATPDEECLNSLIHVRLPSLRRNPDPRGEWPWLLDLYPDEALALAQALIRHATHLLTT